MSILQNLLVILKLLVLFFFQITLAIDIITQLQPLHDGTTLVSKNGTFELGFFNPGNSPNRYVGIWYKNIPVRRAVWVANRDNPIKDNSSKLIINPDGNLVLLNQNQSLLWSTNKTTTSKTNTSSLVTELLDTGNLVLRDENNKNEESTFLWQSFDHPSDTVLPGMKMGWDRKTGINKLLTAWRNWDDPSPGDLTSDMLLSDNPETVIWKGSNLYYRSGPSTGATTSQIVGLQENPVYHFTFFHNSSEVYYMFTLVNLSVISIVVLNQTLSSRQRLTWVPQSNSWTVYNALPQDSCDVYNVCGANGYCAIDKSPICQCLEEFTPTSPAQWNALYWVNGCVRDAGWRCGVKGEDGFRRFEGMKVPDTRYSVVNESMTLEECRGKCLEDCNCTAFSRLDPSGGGSGCSRWFGNLLDLRVSQSGQDLYVRTVASDSDSGDGRRRKVVLGVSITVSVLVVAVLAFSYIYITKIKRKDQPRWIEANDESCERDELELPFYDLSAMIIATNNFSVDNKLGEGGFGPVYKGTLQDGQEIAVKRLSKSSGQGLVEFKNEVILCAKLQHRNLVKVIGFCVEGDEKMLLYEYMPNKSLDQFIFDLDQRKLLDWSTRFSILHAIARGLLYLHQDSRLRIIHRDLKASNILLDSDMNPKISDFGLARMCGGDQIEGRTNRIAGTYGYMAPEYAIDGLFSTKSDVFSFGVLLLEIVSGKKNKALTYQDEDFNLIAHAWRLWNENIPQKLIDDDLRESCNLSEALRCIQIGLLCVQHEPYDRPNMTSVVVMLSSENALPQPKEPGFLIKKVSNKEEDSSKAHTLSSVNRLTMSLIKAR